MSGTPQSQSQALSYSDRLLQAYQVHCEIADALMREENEERFLRRSSDLLVGSGAYVMAWIGFREDDEAKSIRVAVHSGFEAGYLEGIRVTWGEDESGQGPAGMAIKTCQPINIGNVETDPAFRPWRAHALARGYRSAAAFPVFEKNEVYAVVCVYASRKDQFSADEVDILEQIVKLIGFGIRLYRLENEKNKALSETRNRAAELKAILEHITDGVFVCDSDARVTLINRAGMRLLGMSSADEPARLQWAVSAGFLPRPRREQRAPLSPLERALSGRTSRDAEKRVELLPEGRKLEILTDAVPIRDATGKITGAVQVTRDVSEMLDFERLKDDFISAAAHELKTPITVTKGYAQLLLRSITSLPETTIKMILAIQESSDRIDRIVRDLLDISQLHLGSFQLHLESLDLSSLIHEAAAKGSTLSSIHRVEVLEANPIVVKGDRARILQVLNNLIENAIKYSPGGGVIQIRLRKRERDAVVSVRDEGIGIPQDKQARLFERFYRAHAGTPFDFGGLGVGLFLVREIIRRHGGETWLESVEGKGSTFFFSLPLNGR